MGLYKIIIVDDEAEIREGIKKKIDWEKCGFELVGSAENGREALELAENLSPDVVITDIKMPFMDGLELARILSERMSATKIVIFSGFDDFEYAQKAIQYNVTEYVLKPVGAIELTTLLGNLRSQLDVEFERKNDLQALRSHYNHSLPLLREMFYTRLMDGRIPAQRVPEQAEFYGVQLQGNAWVVALVYFDTGLPGSALDGQSELIPISVRQLLDEILGERYSFRSLLYNDGIGIIAGLSEKNQVIELINSLNFCCTQARRFLNLTLTIGVGSVSSSLAQLRDSTLGAVSALDYRVLIGTGQVIYIDDVEPVRNLEILFDEQDARELASAIKLGGHEAIGRCAQGFITRIRASRLTLGQCQIYFTEMITELLKIVRDYRIDPAEVFGSDFDGSFRIARFASPDELGAWFTELCFSISALIRRERIHSSQAIADNAKLFILENYADPNVSVEMLCNHLHLSPAYFSTMFKRETGMSFVAYLTEIRLEAAAKLLSTTEMKTYEIAELVGYLEPNYFSYVFKRHFGVSPTKYLANITAQN